MYARYQAALVELIQAVLADAELPILMRQAVMLTANTLAVGYSAIWQLCPDGRTLALQASSGWTETALKRSTMSVEKASAVGAAVLEASPVIITDWSSETRFSKPVFLRDHGVASTLAVPIPGQAGPSGSLSVDVTANRLFRDQEIHFLQGVAHVLALAIERSQASTTLEQRVEERTREIEQRLVAAAQERAVLEERQRLARDLHDSVTQALYGITLHAQAAWRLLAAGDLDNASDSLQALHHTAQDALDEMRLLIFELRPPILEQVGLVAALQARLNAVEGRANLHTRLIADEIGDLPAPVEQALYRIALEGLNNVLKHAHAQHITVQLLQAQQRLILEISDDGIGFDLAAARQKGGMGLAGITERLVQIGGTLALQSAPGSGTLLRLEVSL